MLALMYVRFRASDYRACAHLMNYGEKYAVRIAWLLSSMLRHIVNYRGDVHCIVSINSAILVKFQIYISSSTRRTNVTHIFRCALMNIIATQKNRNFFSNIR